MVKRSKRREYRDEDMMTVANGVERKIHGDRAAEEGWLFCDRTAEWSRG